MLIEKLPYELIATVRQNRSLRRYLSSLNKRKEETERSWLWDGYASNPYLDPLEVRRRWEQKLQALARGSKFHNEILSFDLASGDKWGPQGGHPPIQKVLDSTVLPTFKNSTYRIAPSAFSQPMWEEAKRAVIHLLHSLGVKNLRPRSPKQAIKSILDQNADRLQSNSGFPDFTRRRNPEVMQHALDDVASGNYLNYPAVLLFRYYRKKLRMVWMYPFATNLAEAQYYQVLFDALKRAVGPQLTWLQRFFAPWLGFNAVRATVSREYKSGAYLAASDFSSTDEHFTKATTSEVADVLEACFQEEFRSGLRDSLMHMHEIPLLISPSQMVTGDHGVSSGSMWTNFVETIFDLILAKYAEILTSGKVKGLFAIGDDMAWIVDGAFSNFKRWLDELGRSVGQLIKAEKTMLEPHKIKTLQRLFQRGYRRANSDELRGVYPTMRALNSLLYPERFHRPSSWSFDMFAVRVFTILENVVDHPLFDEFVKFVLSGNPRLKTWAQQNDKLLASIQQEANLIPGLVPTYNQENKERGLWTFRSIDVARRFRVKGVA